MVVDLDPLSRWIDHPVTVVIANLVGVELLGRLVTRDRWWPLPGLALHITNGALFGAVYALARPFLPGPEWARGLLAAEFENLALWPLAGFIDRYHPAREKLSRLGGNRRALAQATWRHAIFGLVLGTLLQGSFVTQPSVAS